MMKRNVGRREFVKAGAAAGALAASGSPAFGQGPTVSVPKSVKPVVITSANGNEYKNGGPRTAVDEAFQRIVKGEDVLDALIAGVNDQRAGPRRRQRGLRRAAQRRRRRAARRLLHARAAQARGRAWPAWRACARPSRVAQAVLDQTDHHLLVGRGAQEFARQLGLPDRGRPEHRALAQALAEWKRRIDPKHWLGPARSAPRRRCACSRQMVAEGLRGPPAASTGRSTATASTPGASSAA